MAVAAKMAVHHVGSCQIIVSKWRYSVVYISLGFSMAGCLLSGFDPNLIFSETLGDLIELPCRLALDSIFTGRFAVLYRVDHSVRRHVHVVNDMGLSCK